MNKYHTTIQILAMRKTLPIYDFMKAISKSRVVKALMAKKIEDIENNAYIVVYRKNNAEVYDKNKKLVSETPESTTFSGLYEIIKKIIGDKKVEVYATPKDLDSHLANISHLVYPREEYNAWKKSQREELEARKRSDEEKERDYYEDQGPETEYSGEYY